MSFSRGSGILLHPTSLPGEFGIGDLGPGAFRFVDFLIASRQTYWQILPLSPTGYGDSPYSSVSAFAGNTLLISPEKLVEEGLIAVDDIGARPDFPTHKVDFGTVYVWKSHLLPRAFENFQHDAHNDLRSLFEKFCSENKSWLDDYALYRSIKAAEWQKPWYEWPSGLKMRDEQELRIASERLSDNIQAEKFCQFIFFRQWHAVKEYANSKGVKMIGDVPIFVALDSVDVWCNQDKFKLNADGTAREMAGVPPDYFSSTGQLWGNPLYDWDAMRGDNFGWWTARIGFALKTVDIVRLDHFIGFIRNWSVPGGDKTAENGQWIDVPGGELFSLLRESFGSHSLIAEDLGVVTPAVEELRDTFGIPGMRILQYAFGGNTHDSYLPHNYVQNSVAYTGTHDNDTSAGWYRSARKDERDRCRRYLGSNGRGIYWEMVRACMASVADTAIVPMQDILGLGGEARMNTPGTGHHNWQWRLASDALTEEVSSRLAELTVMYGRTWD